MRFSNLLVAQVAFLVCGCSGEAITPVEETGAPESSGDASSGGTWGSDGSGDSSGDSSDGHSVSTGGTLGNGGAVGYAGSAGASAGGWVGAGSVSGAGGSVGGLPEGVPLIPFDGWVDVATNSLGIQGAVYAYADDHSELIRSIYGEDACISGEAARVDLGCTTEPGRDCWGEYWGAAIGMNLNQPIDEQTQMGVDPSLPYDATGLAGFAFMITGSNVPTALRFMVETQDGAFCTPSAQPILPGANVIRFSDLAKECWLPGAPLGVADITGLVKISWQVTTNTTGTVPFDFCVSDLLALSN